MTSNTNFKSKKSGSFPAKTAKIRKIYITPRKEQKERRGEKSRVRVNTWQITSKRCNFLPQIKLKTAKRLLFRQVTISFLQENGC
jgi:hypothetical protein